MTLTSGQLEIQQRNEANRIVIEDLSVCYYCNSTGLKETDKFCPNCAFPQQGEQIEMRLFIRKAFDKQKLLEKQKKAIQSGKNILYVLAALNLIFGIVGAISTNGISILIACIILSILYFFLARWSEKQPFAAILSGFVIYIITNVIGAIADPETIVKGILFKVLIISAFVYGFKGVKDAAKLDEELKSMNTPKDLSTEV